MKGKNWLILALYFVLSLNNLHGQNSEEGSNYIGPKNGTLVIVGGGGEIDSIIKTFIKLAGGKDSPIVIIPTAEGRDNYDNNSGDADIMRKLGATDITILL